LQASKYLNNNNNGKIKWVEWILIVVKEGEPEAMKEVKFLLEIKPLIDIGAIYIYW
jgi:hypothetical protein